MKPCICRHPKDEHSVYGCADDCACEWMPRRGVRVVCTCDPGPEGQHASHCGYGPEDYVAEQAAEVVGLALAEMQQELANAEQVIRGAADSFRQFAESVIEQHADMLRPIEPADWVRAGELLDFLDIEHCDCPTPLHTMRCGAGGHVRVICR